MEVMRCPECEAAKAEAAKAEAIALASGTKIPGDIAPITNNANPAAAITPLKT